MNDPTDPGDPPDTRSMGKVMALCAWILAILLLTLFFTHWTKTNRLNTTANVVTINGIQQTILKRNYLNQYKADGTINGKPVIFLLDTGATEVVIPSKIAKALNLIHGAEITADTAAGNVTVHETRIDELTIGNIKLHNVLASINPKMEGEDVLLGMSALRRITFQQEGDNLILTVTKQRTAE